MRMIMKIAILSVLALLLAATWAATPASAQTITVQNPSFELPVYPGTGTNGNINIPGWVGKSTLIGVITTAGPHYNNGLVPDGSQVIWMQKAGSIKQGIPGFKAGKTYRVSLMANARVSGDSKATMSVKINNVEMANSPTTLTAVEASGSKTKPFTLFTSTFTAAADGISTLTVAHVMPANPGTLDRTLFFDDVNITEVVPTMAVVTPASLAFGSVAAGQVKDLTVNVRNAGDTTFTLSSVSLQGTTTASYSVLIPPTIPAKIAGSATLPVKVRFAPTAAGTYNGAQLKLVTDLATSGTFVLPITGVCSNTAPTTGWPIQCVILPTGQAAPVIDGVINADSEYAYNGTPVPVRLNLGNLTAKDNIFTNFTHNGASVHVWPETTTDDADLSGVFYFVCDTQALYVAAEVKDQTLIPYSSRAATAPNGGDCFQVCLDYDLLRPTASDTHGKVFIPSWAATNSDSSKPADFNAFWPTSAPNPMTGTTWKVITNATGYVLEARIPWTAFTASGKTFTKPFPPADGQQAGILPLLCDFDVATAGGNAFMYTAGAGSGAGTIGNASAYSTLTFVKSPQMPPNAVKGWTFFR